MGNVQSGAARYAAKHPAKVEQTSDANVEKTTLRQRVGQARQSKLMTDDELRARGMAAVDEVERQKQVARDDRS